MRTVVRSVNYASHGGSQDICVFFEYPAWEPSSLEAFKVILSSGRKPEKIMTDQGTEFLNRHFRALMKEEDIELYNTYNETKA